MNLSRETVKIGVLPGNRAQRRRSRRVQGLGPLTVCRRVSLSRASRRKARGRPQGRSCPRSEQPIHELSGLGGKSRGSTISCDFEPFNQLRIDSAQNPLVAPPREILRRLSAPPVMTVNGDWLNLGVRLD